MDITKYGKAILNGGLISTIAQDVGWLDSLTPEQKEKWVKGLNLGEDVATLFIPGSKLYTKGALGVTKAIGLAKDYARLSRITDLGANVGAAVDQATNTDHPIFHDLGLVVGGVASGHYTPFFNSAMATLPGKAITGLASSAFIGKTLLDWKDNAREGRGYDNARNAIFSAISLPTAARAITGAQDALLRSNGRLSTFQQSGGLQSSKAELQDIKKELSKVKYRNTNALKNIETRLKGYIAKAEGIDATEVSPEVLSKTVDEFLSTNQIHVEDGKVFFRSSSTGKWQNLEAFEPPKDKGTRYQAASSLELDHLKPKSTHEYLMADPRNFDLTGYQFNRAAGNVEKTELAKYFDDWARSLRYNQNGAYRAGDVIATYNAVDNYKGIDKDE